MSAQFLFLARGEAFEPGEGIVAGEQVAFSGGGDFFHSLSFRSLNGSFLQLFGKSFPVQSCLSRRCDDFGFGYLFTNVRQFGGLFFLRQDCWFFFGLDVV